MSAPRLACAALALALGAGCGDDGGGSQPEPQPPPMSLALSCQPLAIRNCPCAEGGMGTQTCVATGDAYGPCLDCPPPQAPPPAAGGGGMSALEPDAGPAQPSVSDAGAPDAAPPGDASTMDGDGGGPGSGVVAQGTAPGTSCGVGLPVLCALETEKCCARTLRTDTCVPVDATCDCDLPNCTVMEAHCDGPEDCAEGQVCCGTLAGGSGYERFECVASCDYNGTQRIACHQDAPECPGGTECANSQLLTNVQVCIDPATIRQ